MCGVLYLESKICVQRKNDFFFALISNPVVGCEILWLSLNSLPITTICNYNYLNERLAELQYMILAVLLGE